jgi:hypothetical protein
MALSVIALAGTAPAAFVAPVGTALATGFDEALKAPKMTDTGELTSQSRSIASRLDQYRNADPLQLMQDAALVRDQFDLTWKLQRAVDEHQRLDGLDEAGLTLNPDGSVTVDINAFPHWLRYDERLSGLVPGWNLSIVGPELIARGFRETDLDILERYVATHDVRRLGSQRVLPIAISFNNLVTRSDRLKRPVNDAQVLSYVYQRSRVRSETSREWTAGLLSSLDAQRRRILFNYVAEMKTTVTWTPEDQPAALAAMLSDMRRPDFAARATQEIREVTQ